MTNGTTSTEIHNEHHKLFSGSIVKGINTIDSFTFSVLPDNPAFGTLRDFVTLVNVYNVARQRYEFFGRVLYTSPQMDDSGLITQEAICESYLGFLCDSQQEYTAAQDWTVRTLLSHFISTHNSQLEDYKRLQLRSVKVVDEDGKLKGLEIQRENTWEAIKKNLLDVLGGEIRFYVESGTIYLDYVMKLGETRSTELALSKNMKSIVKEKNPSAFITRLIPLGAKKGDDTEERYDITSVNGGKKYLDDDQAITEYGLHVGYVEFDDVTKPATLFSKALRWLEANNKVSIKYSVTALDLSLIGLDVDDFDVCNTYPLKNPLLGIDDEVRISKKTIDVCDETKSSIEIGESFKTLSELQRRRVTSVGKLGEDVAEIRRNYVTNQKFNSEIGNKVSKTELVSELNNSEDAIVLTSDRLVVDSTHFKLDANGTITASNLKMDGGTITMADDDDKWVELGVGGGLRVLDLKSMNSYYACAQYSANVLRFGRSTSFGGEIENTHEIVYNPYGPLDPVIALYGDWVGNTSGSIVSDPKLKHDIEALDERYETFVDHIIPRRFKYNDGRSGRYHAGYITTEIQEALKAAGISEKEFAGLCTFAEGDEGEISALRYTEFIALNTYIIQRLKARVEALEKRLTALESKEAGGEQDGQS